MDDATTSPVVTSDGTIDCLLLRSRPTETNGWLSQSRQRSSRAFAWLATTGNAVTGAVSSSLQPVHLYKISLSSFFWAASAAIVA